MSVDRHKTGDRVVLRQGHPWAGERGVVEGYLTTPVGRMYRVKLDGPNLPAAGAKDEHLMPAPD